MLDPVGDCAFEAEGGVRDGRGAVKGREVRGIRKAKIQLVFCSRIGVRGLVSIYPLPESRVVGSMSP